MKEGTARKMWCPFRRNVLNAGLLITSGVDLDLLKARDAVVRQAAALARTLRICVSSRTRPDTAAMRDSVQDGPPLWAVR